MTVLHYKLGKKPARDAVALKFSTVFNANKLPDPPAVFGHESLVPGGYYGMLANDQWGDCVVAGGAHETMIYNKEAGITVNFSDASVLSDYSAITGFNPNDPNTDQGTDVQLAAAYRQKTGLLDASGKRHTVDAYAALKVGDLDELALATWLFGAVGCGFNIPSSAEQQFNQGLPWSVVQGDTIEGGHYVPCVGKNSAGNFVFVTWGRVQAATPQWVSTYMDEAIVYLSIESINNSTKITPEGFNLTALTEYLKELT